MSRIPVPTLRPVTVKVLAELSQSPTHLFRFGSIVGQPNKFALTAIQGDAKINLVLDGQTALQFAEEIKKGIMNS